LKFESALILKQNPIFEMGSSIKSPGRFYAARLHRFRHEQLMGDCQKGIPT